MVRHKDLPVGSRQWANALDDALDKVTHLESVVQRVTKDLKLDYSDPLRQYNVNGVPSVSNPVQMKMSSMHDIEVPNVQDGDVLTWDGLKGRWVAGRYEGPAKPTNYGQNSGVHPDDPIEIVEPEPEPGATVDLWYSYQIINRHPDPKTVGGTDAWFSENIAGYSADGWSSATFSKDSATGDGIGGSVRIEVTGANPNYSTGEPKNMTVAYLPVSPNPVGQSTRLGMRLMAQGGEWHPNGSWSGSVHGYDKTNGTYVKGQTLVQPRRGGGAGAGVWEYCFDSDWSYNMSEDLNWYIAIQLHNILEGQTVVVHADDFWLATANPPTFEYHFYGDTPDDDRYNYSWSGSANSSPSIGDYKRSIGTPTTVVIGSDMPVHGRGFGAGESVTVEHTGNSLSTADTVTVVADELGTFQTTMTINAASTEGIGTVSVVTGGWPRPRVQPNFVKEA